MSYHHLSVEQRYRIHALKLAGFSNNRISEEIGVHRSTIGRELNRNLSSFVYDPQKADNFAKKRRFRGVSKIKGELEIEINLLLSQKYSPEQITGRMRLENKPTVSHETIYRYIYNNMIIGGKLHLFLRCKRRKRRKRLNKKDKRGQIPGRVSIDERPTLVAEKSRIGDWEGDTVIGANHKGALVTLVERKSKFTFIALVQNKDANSVAEAIEKCFMKYPDKVFTLTTDNGKEFANHQSIAKNLGIQIYFAHPYHSWERGLNENTNGLIRQYFPKKTNFLELDDQQVQFVMDEINNRPRKTIGYLTPNEAFFQKPP